MLLIQQPPLLLMVHPPMPMGQLQGTIQHKQQMAMVSMHSMVLDAQQ